MTDTAPPDGQAAPPASNGRVEVTIGDLLDVKRW